MLSEAGVPQEKIQTFKTVEEALQIAIEEAHETGRIVTFGSFLTVASAIEYLKEKVGRN